MNRSRKVEVPYHLVLTSMLSTGITITVSISYIVLSVLCLVYRYQCDTGSLSAIDGADYFFNLLYRVYIQKDGCENSLAWTSLTQADSVFVLNILTLCASVMCCIAAGILMTMVLTEEKSQYLHLAAYVYIAVCVASLVVDLTFASHFGMDYTYLTNQLNLSNPGLAMNYDRDLVRLGALLLMALSMKGFVATAINCILLVLIVVYVLQYRQLVQKDEHSIHKLGALSAYDQPRRQDPWQPESQMFYRGQVNPAYMDDTLTPPHSPRREPSSAGYSRSESWQNTGVSGTRPFSYLEEPKRVVGPPSPRAPPAPRPPAWRRDARSDWPPPPPVPAPDYSPHTPRRLKPALKPYM